MSNYIRQPEGYDVAYLQTIFRMPVVNGLALYYHAEESRGNRNKAMCLAAAGAMILTGAAINAPLPAIIGSAFLLAGAHVGRDYAQKMADERDVFECEVKKLYDSLEQPAFKTLFDAALTPYRGKWK